MAKRYTGTAGLKAAKPQFPEALLQMRHQAGDTQPRAPALRGYLKREGISDLLPIIGKCLLNIQLNCSAIVSLPSPTPIANFLTVRSNSMKLPTMPKLSRGFFLLCLILAFFSCTPFPAQEPERTDFLRVQNLTGVRGGNIVLAVSSDPSSFNRMLASGLANTLITDRLSADLVHINRSTLQLEPALATRWETDKTGRIYTIHLRRGVRFSDNTPIHCG